MLEFLRSVGHLKTLPRQGWVDRGVPAPESVADHSYRMAMMAWMLGWEAGLDTDRLVKLVLVHDLPEAEVGDATPYAQILARGIGLSEAVPRWRELLSAEELAAAKRDKHRVEAEGLQQLAASLPARVRAELTELWMDYAQRRTPEACFVAEIDKLEALLQAIEYRDAGYEADVENFLLSARQEIQHPVLLALLAELQVLADSPSGDV
jgi:putative hydrolase of HD superfamily